MQLASTTCGLGSRPRKKGSQERKVKKLPSRAQTTCFEGCANLPNESGGVEFKSRPQGILDRFEPENGRGKLKVHEKEEQENRTDGRGQSTPRAAG